MGSIDCVVLPPEPENVRQAGGSEGGCEQQPAAAARCAGPITPVLLPAGAVLHVDVVGAGPVDAVPAAVA